MARRWTARLRTADRPGDLAFALYLQAAWALRCGDQPAGVAFTEEAAKLAEAAGLRLLWARIVFIRAKLAAAACLINSSVAGLVTYTSYGAAKAWAIRFSQALSAQLAGTGVQALALCPGLVHTEFHVRGNVDAAGAPAFMWLGVERVVDECLRDLRRGKTISIPSKRYRVLVGAGRFVPSGFAARVARNRGLRRKKS